MGIHRLFYDHQNQSSAVGPQQVHHIGWLAADRTQNPHTVGLIDAPLRETAFVPVETDASKLPQPWGQSADQVVQFGREISRPRPPCAIHRSSRGTALPEK